MNMHKSPDGKPVRLLGAGAYAAPRGKDYPEHQHECWEIIYYREGRIDLVVGGRAVRTEPGAVIASPPRVAHAERAYTAYANYCLAIDAPPTMPWAILRHDDAGLGILRTVKAICDESSRYGPDREAMLDLLVGQLDLQLRRVPQAAAPRDVAQQVVRHAEVLFEQRMAYPVTVGEIAAKVGVATSTLRAHFASVRGQSPHAYLLERRLELARAMLRTSEATIEMVAELCGFHSASHLTRHFKSRFGHSPGRHRRTGEGRRTFK